MGVLHILKIAGGLNINQLALIMHKDRGTVSRCVESLCKKNYVKKIRHADDKRIFLASLTSDGEAFLDMLFIHFQRISTPLSKILSQDEVQSFHTLLDKVCRHYDSVISQIQKSIKNHD